MSQVLPGMKHSSVATLSNNLYQRPLDSTSARVSLCLVRISKERKQVIKCWKFILRSGRGLTSFNLDNSANLAGESKVQ